MDTELKLLNWRDGSTKAERLCANVLHLEGFSSIDPQCPLGGPDGLKDVLCTKNDWKYIGASYFAIEQNSFNEIKAKFKHDLEGVKKNSADGIVFLTNQKLSPTERDSLIDEAKNESIKAIIYHRERIRVILDTPLGFAIRLEYLGIEMSKEEQLSFFSQQRNLFEDILKSNADYIIKVLSKKIDGIKFSNSTMHNLLATIRKATENIMAQTQMLSKTMMLPADDTEIKDKFPTLSNISENLTTDIIKFIHKAVLFEESNVGLGNYRNQEVWIGSINSTPETALYVPPKHDAVKDLLEKLINDWNSNYKTINQSEDKNLKINAIAEFHYKFLSIHPFLDGNKRVARFLLNQQVNELLKTDRKITIENSNTYINSFLEAQKGNLEPLTNFIVQSIYGDESV